MKFTQVNNQQLTARKAIYIATLFALLMLIFFGFVGYNARTSHRIERTPVISQLDPRFWGFFKANQ